MASKNEKEFGIGCLITGVVAVLIIIGLILWFLFATTKGQDIRTNIQSDVTGIEREIVVYSQMGDEISRYSGKNVRLDYEKQGRVQILLDNGSRVQVSNAIVIVEEPQGREEEK